MQQINLYQDRFKEKRVLLSAVDSITLFVLSIVGIALGSYYLNFSQQQAVNTQTDIAANKKQIEQRLQTAKSTIEDITSEVGLDEKINAAQQEIRSSQNIIQFLNTQQFGSGEGFSSFLQAFSRLSTNGVWLEKIHISENQLNLLGSSTSGELIPQYFQQFESESIFKGMSFDVFEIFRSEAEPWRVDFKLSTQEDKNG